MTAKITDEQLQKWASILLDHSLGGITKDDVVMIKGEHVAWPLINALQEGVIKAGGLPDVWLVPPDNDRGRVWGGAMARLGTPEQIARVPEWWMGRYERMTKFIEVLGAEDPSLYAGLPKDNAGAIAAADMPFMVVRLAKQWALTLYPTQGFADMEEMDLDRYTSAVVDASLADPAPLVDLEAAIGEAMGNASEIKIVTYCAEMDKELTLTISIAGRRVQQSYGKHNWPDGEVFTSPDANSVQGEIFVDLPILYGGTRIQGIYLKFDSGVITEYNAQKGGEQLKTIVETDEGSHRLGEVALGMNPGLKEVLCHPLFVEKVGGTLHIAIGASYPQCYVEDPESDAGKSQLGRFFDAGVLNKSAQHVDIVTDFREGGAGRRVELDGKALQVRDGVWVVE
jgi:aminopeptidase